PGPGPGGTMPPARMPAPRRTHHRVVGTPDPARSCATRRGPAGTSRRGRISRTRSGAGLRLHPVLVRVLLPVAVPGSVEDLERLADRLAVLVGGALQVLVGDVGFTHLQMGVSTTTRQAHDESSRR